MTNTTKIQTGIYNLTQAEYDEIPAINQSSLKHFLKCPAYFLHMKENPKVQTDDMAFGSMVHMCILTPDLFEEKYFVTAKITRSGKKWEDVLLNAGLKHVVFTDNYIKAIQMRKRLSKNLYFKKMLPHAKIEQCIIWKDKDTDLYCKGRLDGFLESENSSIIFDLKTTTDCFENKFERDLWKFNYYIQAAFYMDGLKAITGKEPESFMIFAVEKTEPFINTTHEIPFDSEVIEFGREKYKELLYDYKNCIEIDNFDRGPEEKLNVIEDVPEWRKNINKTEDSYYD